MDIAAAATVRNPSLLPGAQEFLRRFNALEVGGPDQPRPPWVFRLLNERFCGPGRKPARDAAREFVRHYEEGNERVRAEYFPDRDRLFSDDFDHYPLEETQVSDGEVLEVAMAVIEHLSSQPGSQAAHPSLQGAGP